MSTSIAIVATHPIQYQVPWFQLLSRQPGIRLKVYFAILPDEVQQGAGFEIPFKWDIPMLEGYRWRALPNRCRQPSLQGFFSSSTPSIRSVLASDRPDVVIITGWNALPLMQALWACLALRLPRIVRGESNSLRRRPAWLRLLHRAFLSGFDAFLAIGKANREFYLQAGVDASRIFECRYFIDNDRFSARCGASRAGRSGLREKWGITERSFCFVYVGKLEPKKHIFDLVDALQAVLRARQDLHLLVVGTGELGTALKAKTEGASLPVSFAGFLNQTELPDAYAAADCLVLPSDDGETWGLVVNEAMACGLPAIVSDQVGCGPDLVEPDATGFVFPCGDVAALAACLARMASNPASAGAMGERAAERIRAYSAEAAVAGTLHAIEFALSQRS